MTAPIPTAPTNDLSLTAQTKQHDPNGNQVSVLDSMAKVAPKAKQAEINVRSYLKDKSYVRP